MNWISRISAQTRLSIIFALLTMMAALFGSVAIDYALKYQEQLSELQSLTDDHQERSAAVEAFDVEASNSIHAILEEEGWAFYQEQSQFNSKKIDAFISYERMNADENSRGTIENLNDLHQQHKELWHELLLVSFDSIEAAQPRVDEELIPLQDEIRQELNALNSNSNSAIQSLIADMENSFNETLQYGGFALAALGLMLVIGVATTNNIFQPLQALLNAVHHLEAGKFEPRVLERYTDRHDELGELARAFTNMASTMIEADRQQKQFITSASRFVPSEYLDFLEKEDITKVDLGDNVAAEMAVMFSDIRGFTTMSETMSAQENFAFVNDYIQRISPLIQEHDGFIVKFLGDGMMAIFPYGVDDAVKAGVDKQKMVKAFNEEIIKRGYPAISVGVGIHTGSMMVGMIGEERRLQGDAFSDNVNLTSRIEGLNKFFGTSMIISQETLDSLTDKKAYKMRFLGRMIVKGKTEPLALYEVYDGLKDEVVALREATQADFACGLKAYTEGQFTVACEAFEAVLAQDPHDKTAQYYLDVCQRHAGQPVPAGWDGVIVMESK